MSVRVFFNARFPIFVVFGKRGDVSFANLRFLGLRCQKSVAPDSSSPCALFHFPIVVSTLPPSSLPVVVRDF